MAFPSLLRIWTEAMEKANAIMSTSGATTAIAAI